MTNTIYFSNIDRDEYSSSSSRSDFSVEIVSVEDVDHMELEVFKEKIRVWIISMPIALKSVKELNFHYGAVNTVEKLLSFGDAVARSKKSPDKLFLVLDMYNTMCQLQPELQTILSCEAYYKIRELALTLKKRLADMARSTLDDFDEIVENNDREIDVVDGGVHPMTCYVINFLKILLHYESTVKQLLEDSGMNNVAESWRILVTVRILQALQTALDRKSEKCSDPALIQFFLMNNISYIVTFGRSKAKHLLGDEWVLIHQGIVQKHAYQYVRVSLQKVLQAIAWDGLLRPGCHRHSNAVNVTVLKHRFTKFNMLFKDFYQRGSQLTMLDGELRDSLRLSLSIMLLPAYRSFIKVCSWNHNLKGLVRYTVDDVERMLDELFEGKERVDRNNQCF